jgi:hypothetical protein
MCKTFAGNINVESFGHIRFEMGIIRYSIKIVSLLFISHQHYLNHSLQAFIHFNPFTFTLNSHNLFESWSFIYMITFGNYEPVYQWNVSFPHHPGSSNTVNRIWYVGFNY